MINLQKKLQVLSAFRELSFSRIQYRQIDCGVFYLKCSATLSLYFPDNSSLIPPGLFISQSSFMRKVCTTSEYHYPRSTLFSRLPGRFDSIVEEETTPKETSLYRSLASFSDKNIYIFILCNLTESFCKINEDLSLHNLRRILLGRDTIYQSNMPAVM